MIRCFFYNSKYIQTLEEAQTKILKNLKSQIKIVSEPSKAILNSVYAKCLNDYYLKITVKYTLEVPQTLETDFLLWSNKTFKSKLALHSIKASQTQFYKTSEVLSISI
jgi:hypothetical protein